MRKYQVIGIAFLCACVALFGVELLEKSTLIDNRNAAGMYSVSTKAEEEATATPSATTEPSVTTEPSSKVEATATPEVAKVKHVVALDPGHQKNPDDSLEPIGPGSKKQAKKITYGATGIATGVGEYELNLVIAEKVKAALEEKGYEVVMTRESNDVNISNKERTIMSNESDAEILIRIHANGSENTSKTGALTVYPSSSNIYVGKLSDDCYKLAKCMVDEYCKATDTNNIGPVISDYLTGINWSEIPVTIIEMGYMSNEGEDKLMQEESYQKKMVEGICNGIYAYFDAKDK